MDANVNQMKQTRVPRIRRGVEILGMSCRVELSFFSAASDKMNEV